MISVLLTDMIWMMEGVTSLSSPVFLFSYNKPNFDLNYVPQKFTALLLR